MNKHVPHVLVLPEDDANRQLAVGFLQDPALDGRRIKILPVAGGWEPVLEHFNRDQVRDMERNPLRFMVLLIDFDEHRERLNLANARIPAPLRNRVFVLGVWSHPEKLRVNLGQSLETIGTDLARDCRETPDNAWSHRLLSHNASELERLRNSVQPILFRAS